ncbi:MAG: DNA repair protein RecO [Pedosphaera sp.]|nr:DNA repair protein RecO [Pedosphaera sp.]
MDQRTPGLILRTRALTETSLIVHWVTPDLGRIATVAKGALRPKSPFRGKLDLFYLCDFSFHRSRRSELHNLHEVSVLDFHSGLRQELGYLQQASYFTQLVEQTTESDSPVPGLFELFLSALKSLTEASPQALTVYAFETKLLHQLGLKPDFRKAQLSPGSAEILERISSANWTAIQRIKPSQSQDGEIGKFLAGFIQYNVGKLPRGRPAAVGFEYKSRKIV